MSALLQELQGLLTEGRRGPAKPGDVHQRADGDYEKQRDGTWARLAAGHGKKITYRTKAARRRPVTPASVLPRSSEEDEVRRKRAAREMFSRVIGTTSATIQDIKHPAHAKTVGWIPGAGPWIEVAQGLPADTWKEHFDTATNVPHADRARLHEPIYESFLDRTPVVPKNQQPVAVVLMGLPASGKSSAIGVLGIDERTFVPADADLIKNYLPEFQEGLDQRARNAAGLVHNESAYLAEKIRDKAIENNQCLIADGTGSDLTIWKALIEKLKGKGYQVHLLMAELPDDQCKRRIGERAEKTGRWVPPHVVDGLSPKIHKNFMLLKDLSDTAMVFSTETNTPTPIYTRFNDGPEEIYDDAAYANMRRRSGVSEAKQRVEGVRKTMREADKPRITKPPGRKPRYVADDAITAAFVTGYAAELALYESLPIRFAPGEGTIMIADAETAI